MPQLRALELPVSRHPAESTSPRARSNSCNLVSAGEVLRARLDPCPLREGPGSDPLRTAYLRVPGRMLRFETRTTDLSEAELRDVRAREQLYLDISTKIAPDDFERDLRKLSIAAECRACPQLARCGATWAPAADNVFARDRSHVERILRTLSGRVLDVGCGDGPYLRALEERVAAGGVQYLGLDPDAARIRLLGSRHPWASYVAGDLAALARSRPAGAPPFDHVLVLRSYNHLSEPGPALGLALSLLAPGGTLLVVDNVAFGLVRGAEHAARAERGPAAFEHFRNDGLADAMTLLDGEGLTLLEARDVGPRTSNEWLVHYRKEGAS